MALLLTIVATLPQPALAAGAVTDDNVAERIEQASTKADHEALATYFREKATEAGKKAELHEKMLAHVKSWESGKEESRHSIHCGVLVRSARAAEAAYKDLANEQSRLAQAGQ